MGAQELPRAASVYLSDEAPKGTQGESEGSAQALAAHGQAQRDHGTNCQPRGGITLLCTNPTSRRISFATHQLKHYRLNAYILLNAICQFIT